MIHSILFITYVVGLYNGRKMVVAVVVMAIIHVSLCQAAPKVNSSRILFKQSFAAHMHLGN